MTEALPAPAPTADHEWTDEEINHQITIYAHAVIRERQAQEVRWGKQNVPDLQPGSNGVHEIGRSYRAMAQIMKYQNDRNLADGHPSMDLILLEEVFEALEKAVEIADALTPEERNAARKELIDELIQVSAVAEKWAAMVDRDEPR